MVTSIEGLKYRYKSDPDTYVAGNNFIYWEKGNPRKAISPDVYVVFGVSKRKRDSYKAWEEGGRLPDIVFEFTSMSTKMEDEEIKGPLYRDELKVKEYIQFDPKGEYLKPRLQGIRMAGESYEPIPIVDGRLYSEVLKLWLEPDGSLIRMIDPVTQKWIPTPFENALRAESEAAKAQAERQAREEAEWRAESESAKVKAEHQAREEAEWRAESEAAKAQAAHQAREEAERRAESERQARIALEAEIALLRAAAGGRSDTQT
jgi:hypothetical protein